MRFHILSLIAVVVLFSQPARAAVESWSINPSFSESNAGSSCTIRYLDSGNMIYRRYDDNMNTSTSTDGITWSAPTPVTGLYAAHSKTWTTYTTTGRYLNPTCVVFANGTIYLMYEERWEFFDGTGSLLHVESKFYAAKSASTSPNYGVGFLPIVGAGADQEVFTPDSSGDGSLVWAPDLVYTAPGTLQMFYVAAPSGAPVLRTATSTDRGLTWPVASRSDVTLTGDLESGVPFASGTLITHPDAFKDAAGNYNVYFTSPSDAGTTYQYLRVYAATGTSASSLSIETGARLEPTTSTDCYGTPDIVEDGTGGHLLYFSSETTGTCGSALFDRKMATSFRIPTITAGPTTVDLSTVGGTAFGGLWSIPVYDGTDLVISTEYGGIEINAAKFDLDLNYSAGTLTTVATTADVSTDSSCQDTDGDGNSSEGEGNIADHKHVVLGTDHYLVFSNSGSDGTTIGNGGCLKLIKLDSSLARVSSTDVVVNDQPTNDMFLVEDGTSIHVGKFSPSVAGGHEIHTFDTNLNLTGNASIGSPSHIHSNGAAVVFANSMLSMIAPESLAYGMSDELYGMQFDSLWSPIGARDTVVTDSSGSALIGLATALTWDPASRVFIGHYILNHVCTSNCGGGDIYRVILDRHMRVVNGPTAVVTSTSYKYHRPHTVLVGNRLFLGYDGETPSFTPYVTYFDLSP